jgi:hypothetical protein
MTTVDESEELLQHHRIRQVLVRYFRGIDRLDFELVRSCYHPEATDQHPTFTGDRDAFIAWVRPALTALAGTMHILGNNLIEFGRDQAVSESYVTAYHWQETDPSQPTGFTSGFRYIDRFERRDGEWRIARRVAIREWTRHEVDFVPHRTSADDPGYRMRSAAQHLGSP